MSGLASLRTLSAKILEPSGVLTDQILGAFGPKLKEIEITGDALHSITLDAFEGMKLCSIYPTAISILYL